MDATPTSDSDHHFWHGVALFNAGQFWHAHEAWETCWLAASGDEARAYQALIQAAAALVKWQQGNRRGLGLNWAKASARLATLPPTFRGLDLEALAADMARLLDEPAGVPPTLRQVSHPDPLADIPA